jgi:RNA polymerase sigma-70 factor, ECF subfamily
LETIENLYKQHFNSLHQLAQKMHCHDVADDIVQDVFTDYFQKKQMGKEVKYPKSYLYRSTLNKCIDEQRKGRKFASKELPEESEDGSRHYEKKEERAIVSKSLVMMDVRDRELAILYSEGLSYKEISEITTIPFTSIGKTLARALKKLKKELKTNGYEMH